MTKQFQQPCQNQRANGAEGYGDESGGESFDVRGCLLNGTKCCDQERPEPGGEWDHVALANAAIDQKDHGVNRDSEDQGCRHDRTPCNSARVKMRTSGAGTIRSFRGETALQNAERAHLAVIQAAEDARADGLYDMADFLEVAGRQLGLCRNFFRVQV